MLRKRTPFCAFLIIAAFAQQAGAAKDRPFSATGTVKAYEPGKTIEVEAKGAPHTYDLTSPDTTYTIAPDLEVGAKVKLVEKTDAAGHKTVTIEPTGKSQKQPAGEKSERPMSEKPPIPIR